MAFKCSDRFTSGLVRDSLHASAEAQELTAYAAPSALRISALWPMPAAA
jgi:hypothetical protein